MDHLLVLLLAVVFCFVTGVNDGGALLAPGLRLPRRSVVTSGALLVLCVVGVPMLGGTAVARAMHEGLVPDPVHGPDALVIGFVTATVVVLVMARSGAPTSLTLAVVGGVVGAGIGTGAGVDTVLVVRVLLLGLLAPVVGAATAALLAGTWRWVRVASYERAVSRGHWAAFLLQSLAYGANDGQKMLVLFFVAAGTAAGTSWWAYLVVAGTFALGAAAGVRRMSSTIGTGVLAASPVHTVTAELSAGVVVIGCALAGVPVSMTQSVTGGLVGAGLHEGLRRLRWQVAGRLAAAWALTLPSTFVLGLGVGLLTR